MEAAGGELQVSEAIKRRGIVKGQMTHGPSAKGGVSVRV
jgi:hypothetical protein